MVPPVAGHEVAAQGQQQDGQAERLLRMRGTASAAWLRPRIDLPISRVPSTKVTPVLARLMITGRIAINRNFQRKRSNSASSRSCRGACRDGHPMGDRQRGDQEHGKDWVARRRLGFSPIVLRSGGLWGCHPWRPAATGPGLACTPFRPAARPSLLSGWLLISPPCSRCWMSSLLVPPLTSGCPPLPSAAAPVADSSLTL